MTAITFDVHNDFTHLRVVVSKMKQLQKNTSKQMNNNKNNKIQKSKRISQEINASDRIKYI